MNPLRVNLANNLKPNHDDVMAQMKMPNASFVISIDINTSFKGGPSAAHLDCDPVRFCVRKVVNSRVSVALTCLKKSLEVRSNNCSGGRRGQTRW